MPEFLRKAPLDPIMCLFIWCNSFFRLPLRSILTPPQETLSNTRNLLSSYLYHPLKMTITNFMVTENISIRIINAKTQQPYDIMDNQYVLFDAPRRGAEPEPQVFEIALRSEGEPADCHLYLQGTDVETGAFRIYPGKWTTYKRGCNGMTFGCIPTDMEGASDCGISVGADSNGAIKFIFCRPEIIMPEPAVPVVQYESYVIVDMPEKRRHRGGGSAEPQEKSMENVTYRGDSKPKFKELAVVNVGMSDQRLYDVADLKIDTNRNIHIYCANYSEAETSRHQRQQPHCSSV